MITNQRVTSVFPTKRGPPPDPIKRSPGIAGTMHGAGLKGTRRAASFQAGPSHTAERSSTIANAVSAAGRRFSSAAEAGALLFRGAA